MTDWASGIQDRRAALVPYSHGEEGEGEGRPEPLVIADGFSGLFSQTTNGWGGTEAEEAVQGGCPGEYDDQAGCST